MLQRVEALFHYPLQTIFLSLQRFKFPSLDLNLQTMEAIIITATMFRVQLSKSRKLKIF